MLVRISSPSLVPPLPLPSLRATLLRASWGRSGGSQKKKKMKFCFLLVILIPLCTLPPVIPYRWRGRVNGTLVVSEAASGPCTLHLCFTVPRRPSASAGVAYRGPAAGSSTHAEQGVPWRDRRRGDVAVLRRCPGVATLRRRPGVAADVTDGCRRSFAVRSRAVSGPGDRSTALCPRPPPVLSHGPVLCPGLCPGRTPHGAHTSLATRPRTRRPPPLGPAGIQNI